MSIQNCGPPSAQHSNSIQTQPALLNNVCILCLTFRAVLSKLFSNLLILLDLYLEQYSTIINNNQKCIVNCSKISQHCLKFYNIVNEKSNNFGHNFETIIETCAMFGHFCAMCTMTVQRFFQEKSVLHIVFHSTRNCTSFRSLYWLLKIVSKIVCNM